MSQSDLFIERPTRQLVALSAVAAVALAIVYLVLVRTMAGQRFDDLAFDGRVVESPEITRATNDLLHLVTRSTLGLLTTAIVVAALLRRRVRLAIATGAAITASVVTTEVLKLHLLDRPDLDGIAGIEQNSFPSGHATIGMSLSLGIVLVTPHARRWLALVAAVGVSTVFGVGVLATGWHRPSDTIGAYLVCIAVFALVTAVLMRISACDVRDDMGHVEERLDPRATMVAGVLVVAAGVVGLVLTFREDGLRTVEFAADYVAVGAIIIALGAGVVLGAGELLRGVSLDPPRSAESSPDDTSNTISTIDPSGATR
jgi:membrane-associated phospholipid phosphatase